MAIPTLLALSNFGGMLLKCPAERSYLYPSFLDDSSDEVSQYQHILLYEVRFGTKQVYKIMLPLMSFTVVTVLFLGYKAHLCSSLFLSQLTENILPKIFDTVVICKPLVRQK